jgi:hypothetical protein
MARATRAPRTEHRAGTTKTGLGAVIALMAVGVVMAFAVAEITLRLLGISYPVMVTTDPVTGLGHIPNASGRFLQEGHAIVHINSQGLRDREHSLAKPGGVFRIAVLGDSYAEAFQVEDDEPFWSVMQGPLSQRIGRRVEAINFAVSGFGTGSELLALRHKALAYQPDAVLLAVTTGNDVSDNSRALKGVSYLPYFTLHDGTPVLDSSFVYAEEFRSRSSFHARLVSAIAAHSRVVQALNQARTLMRARHYAERRGTLSAEAPGLDPLVYAPPRDSLWRDAWSVTEALMITIHDECRAHGIPLFVVTLSNPVQVDPDSARRDRFARRLGVPDLFYPERRIRELGDRDGFDVLNLAPILQREADSTGVAFHGVKLFGEGHWNREGHRRAGELIAGWLAPRLTGARLAAGPDRAHAPDATASGGRPADASPPPDHRRSGARSRSPVRPWLRARRGGPSGRRARPDRDLPDPDDA